MFRHFINSKLTKSYGSHKTQPDNLLYKTILESYYPKEIAVIDKEQKDIADKRIERTKVRVATLKSKMVIEKAKDNVEKAKKAITEKKAPAKKKSVAKKTDAVKKVVKEFSEQKGVNADHVNDKVKVVTINS